MGPTSSGGSPSHSPCAHIVLYLGLARMVHLVQVSQRLNLLSGEFLRLVAAAVSMN